MRRPALDPAKLEEALRLAAEIYRLHEARQSYGQEMRLLSAATGQKLSKNDIHGAFGSIASEDWAHDLTLSSVPAPDDLSREELIEMIERVCDVADSDWLQH